MVNSFDYFFLENLSNPVNVHACYTRVESGNFGPDPTEKVRIRQDPKKHHIILLSVLQFTNAPFSQQVSNSKSSICEIFKNL